MNDRLHHFIKSTAMTWACAAAGLATALAVSLALIRALGFLPPLGAAFIVVSLSVNGTFAGLTIARFLGDRS